MGVETNRQGNGDTFAQRRRYFEEQGNQAIVKPEASQSPSQERSQAPSAFYHEGSQAPQPPHQEPYRGPQPPYKRPYQGSLSSSSQRASLIPPMPTCLPPPPPPPINSQPLRSLESRTQQPNNRDSRVATEARERFDRVEAYVERNELREVKEAQKIALEDYLKQKPSLYALYTTIRGAISGQIASALVLSSGDFERKRNRKGDLLPKGIQGLAEVIPDPFGVSRVFLKQFGDYLQSRQDKQLKDRAIEIASVIHSSEIADAIGEQIALKMCQIFEHPFRMRTEKQGEEFGIYVSEMFRNFMYEIPLETLKLLRADPQHLHERFMAESLLGRCDWKDKFFQFLNGRFDIRNGHRNIMKFFETLFPNRELLYRCGIRADDGCYYANGMSAYQQYGFRVGTGEEAKALGMDILYLPAELQWTPDLPREIPLLNGRGRPLAGRAVRLDATGAGEALQAFGQRHAKVEVDAQEARREAEFAKTTALQQTGNIVALQSRVERVEAQQMQPLRRGGPDSLARVQEGLVKFYQRNTTIRPTFTEGEIDIGDLPVPPLALIKEKKQKKEKHEMSPEEGREKREEVETPDRPIKTPIALEALFKARHGQKSLLRADPGSGKTTVSKQIGYLWANWRLWANCDHLFIVSGRNLTESNYPPGERSLEHILMKECFLPGSPEEQNQRLFDIQEVIKNSPHKVLVLDGLDEVPRIPEILAQLFEREAFSHVVITSQRHAAREFEGKVDAIIEFDFQNEHIKESISRHFSIMLQDPNEARDQASGLINLMERQPALMELAGKPLMRDALCTYMLDRDQRLHPSGEGEINEMELISRAVEHVFSRRLSRQCDSPTSYENKKQALSLLLGKIAFVMFEQEQYVADDAHIRHYESDEAGINELYDSGLLQIADGGRYRDSRSASFPHYLIQVHFAACYLAELAKNDPREFRERVSACKLRLYMKRLLIATASLLSRRDPRESEKERQQRVMDFFSVLLNGEPKDLVGRYSTRLAIECVEVCPNIEGLYDWIEKEHKVFSMLRDQMQAALLDNDLNLNDELQCISVIRHCIDRGLLKGKVKVKALDHLIEKQCITEEDISYLVEKAGQRNLNDAIKAMHQLKEIGRRAAKRAVPVLIRNLDESKIDYEDSFYGHLRDPRGKRVKAAIDALGEMGRDAVPAIPHLIEKLRNGYFCEQVEKALIKIGEPVVPYVAAHIDRSPSTVVEILGEIGGQEAVAHILKVLPVRKEDALKALVKTMEPEAVIPYLIDALHDDSSGVRAAAMKRLEELGSLAMGAIPKLRWCIKNAKNAKWAQYIIDEIEGVDSIEHFIKGLCGVDSNIVKRAMAGLRRWGVEAIPALKKVVRDSNSGTAIMRALELLEELGSDPSEIAPLLIGLFRKGKEFRSSIDNELIWKMIVQKGEVAVPHLCVALTNDSDYNYPVRQKITQVLGEMGPAAKGAVPSLIQQLQHHRSPVKTDAIEALGEIGEDAREAISPLKCLLHTEKDDGYLIYETVFALTKIMGPNAIPFLVDRFFSGYEISEKLKLVDNASLIKSASESNNRKLFDVMVKAIAEKAVEGNYPVSIQQIGPDYYLFCGQDKIKLSLDEKGRKNLIKALGKHSKHKLALSLLGKIEIRI
ncbi:MAG: HEAT repeat domain-containing protein [Waddliaceae bacterium]